MLLQSSQVILHTEFQTISDETMPFRMADYYLRLKRKFPERNIQQIVIYLKPTSSALVNNLSLERLEALGEDLLNFTSTADLESWLG